MKRSFLSRLFPILDELAEWWQEEVVPLWYDLPTPVRRAIVFVGLIVLWVIHNLLGYATSTPRGFLAVAFTLPIIWLWTRQHSQLVNASIVVLMFWFGMRAAGHGSGNDPDIVMQAMFWTLLPWYGYRTLTEWRKEKKHKKSDAE